MSRKRILIMVGIVILLLVIIDGGLYLATRGSEQPIVLHLNLGPAPSSADSASPTSHPEARIPTPVGAHGVLVNLGTKVVNLADPGGYRYLRVGLVLEFAPADPAYYTLDEEERHAAEEKQRHHEVRVGDSL